MLNRLLTASATLVCLGLLLHGHRVVEYLETTAYAASDLLGEHLPVQVEIDRAQKMLENLRPSIRKRTLSIAREDIELSELQKQIDELKQQQIADRKALFELRRSIVESSADPEVSERTHRKEMLRSDFDRYALNASVLRRFISTHEARCRYVEKARGRLRTIIAARQKLTIELDELQSRVRLGEFPPPSSIVSARTEDAQLARTRELIKDIEVRVSVEERLAETEHHFTDEVTLVPSTRADDICDVVGDYFRRSVPSDSADVAMVE